MPCRWWCESASDITEGVSTLQYKDPQDFIKENNLVVKSMGCNVQCVLNFEDNEASDGGTIVVPKFHKLIEHWCATDNKEVLQAKQKHDASILQEKQQKNLLKKEQKEQRRLERELEKEKEKQRNLGDMELEEDMMEKCAAGISTGTSPVDEDLEPTRSPMKYTNVKFSEHSGTMIGVDTKSVTKNLSGVNVNSNPVEDGVERKEDTNTNSIMSCQKNPKKKKEKGPKQQQYHPPKPPVIFSDSNKWGSSVPLRQPLPWVIMGDDSKLLNLAQRVSERERIFD